MIKYGEKSRQLIRESYVESKLNLEYMISNYTDDILNYFSRKQDIKLIRDALKSRFAVGITETENGFQTYSKTNLSKAIDLGFYETISSGLGNKIINSLATIFTQKNSNWQFLSGEEIADEFTELINHHRANSTFLTELILADRISCATESCPIFVDVAGGNLRYQAINPSCINVQYGKMISDNGVMRGVNELDLEDASCIVIRLATGDNINQTYSFLAIFARSEEFEYGRYVQYQAKNWNSIPSVGDPNCIEYMIDGKICNPLSYLVATNENLNIPEYPIIILRGGSTLVREKAIEVNTSLYDSCVEIDIAYSRILKDSLNSSTGLKVVKNPTNEPLPKTLEGTIALIGGQSIENITIGGEHSRIALEVIMEISKSISEGYGVPGFLIQSELTAESGIALIIKMQPLLQHRDFRVQLNTTEINKLFKIEKSYLEFLTGLSFGEVIQKFDPGTIEIPETEMEKSERLKNAMGIGLISYVKSVRAFYNLATDDQAIEMIVQIQEQNAEYPAPSENALNSFSFTER